MKKRILFVDDVPMILSGLKRMLRPMRNEWDMVFAEGGKEALEKLSQAHFDVVVSDMRMPEIDGAQLLKIVSHKYPHIVRIILSGHANTEMIFKSLAPTHQFLSKPCNAEKLKSTLNKAFTIRNILSNNCLKQVISKIEHLPSLPKLYCELIEELQSPDTSMKKVGVIIARDISMTTKILKLVNSAYFGLGRHVSSPVEAAMYLGLNTVRSLVLSVGVFAKFDEKILKNLSIETIYNHSMTVGILAKLIAQAENQNLRTIEETLIAGMLHDVGKLILADNLPEEYGEILSLTRSEKMTHIQAEKKVLGATHAEVGAYLLGIWGLPDTITEAVAYHHWPGKYLLREFCTLTAVHVANALAYDGSETGAKTAFLGIDLNYLNRLGISDRLFAWNNIWKETKQKG